MGLILLGAVCLLLAVVLYRTRREARSGQHARRHATALGSATTAITEELDYGQPSGVASTATVTPEAFQRVDAFASSAEAAAGTDAAASQAVDTEHGARRALQVVGYGDACLVLTGGRYRLGRSSSNDLKIDEPSVSRHHAEVVVAPGGEYIVHDLNSLNGLFVNGKPTTSARLAPGDRIELGDARLDYIPIAETPDG